MEIPREVAQSAGVPDDLDASVRGPYQIPSPRRRRIAAGIYLAGAAAAGLGPVAGLPEGSLGVAAGLALLALYHWATAWELGIREPTALEIAGREAGFPVGHASAALGFRGWRSRPVWNVIAYSADEPPGRRALVRVDAVEARLIDTYVEEVPRPEATR